MFRGGRASNFYRCVAVSASKVVEAPGARVPFSLEPILFDLEGGHYILPILPIPLSNIVSGRQSAGGSATRGGGGCGDVGSGNIKKVTHKVGATGGPVRVWARYEAHLPSLSLWDGGNS